MTLTKLQTRTAIREYIDDPSGTRWSDTSLDIVTRMIYDGLWEDILDIAPYWNSHYQQIAAPFHPPGYIDIRLTTDGGDLAQRLYRIQQLMANNRVFYAKDPRDYLMLATSNTGDVTTIKAVVESQNTYQILGDQLWFHPLGLSAGGVGSPPFVELRYNFLPSVYTGLADGTAISFPDGSEHALILTTAAYALARADQEDAVQLRAMASKETDRMFNRIRRRYHGPTMPFGIDSGHEIGGI